jgi:hypothetical protein
VFGVVISSKERGAVTEFLFHVQYDRGYSDGSPYGHWINIGIFATRALAEAAVAKLKNKPGFRDNPHGFSITEARLDCAGWEEGFK